MDSALHALLAFTGWTMLLVLGVVSVRSLKVLTGESKANEFPSGQEHGHPIYWRLNRAHVNAVENLVVFAVVVLVGHLAGVTDPLFAQLAWVAVAGRIAQSVVHVASYSHMAVTVRFAFLLVQLGCFAWMGWLGYAAEPVDATRACTVEIRSKGRMQAFKGKGDGATKAAAREAAWKAACATLPKPDVPHCRDDSRFRGSEVVATQVKGDQRTYSATVTVRELAPAFIGEGTSPASDDAACKAAVIAACAEGGAKGDCVASGQYEELTRSVR